MFILSRTYSEQAGLTKNGEPLKASFVDAFSFYKIITRDKLHLLFVTIHDCVTPYPTGQLPQSI